MITMGATASVKWVVSIFRELQFFFKIRFMFRRLFIMKEGLIYRFSLDNSTKRKQIGEKQGRNKIE